MKPPTSPRFLASHLNSPSRKQRVEAYLCLSDVSAPSMAQKSDVSGLSLDASMASSRFTSPCLNPHLGCSTVWLSTFLVFYCRANCNCTSQYMHTCLYWGLTKINDLTSNVFLLSWAALHNYMTYFMRLPYLLPNAFFDICLYANMGSDKGHRLTFNLPFPSLNCQTSFIVDSVSLLAPPAQLYVLQTSQVLLMSPQPHIC